MNKEQIKAHETQYNKAIEHAKKHGIKRMDAGYYLISDNNGNVYTVEQGWRREYTGYDSKLWFVSTDDEGVVGEYITLKDCKASFAQE